MGCRIIMLMASPLLVLSLATFALAGEVSKKSGDPRKGQLKRGEQVYQQACAACHATGVAGAPKVGDKTAWAPHIKLGLSHLVDIAIHGKGGMPPRGGQASLSDEDVRAAVSYMVEKSR